ncbi:MAG: hypothetical protein RBU23_10530 [Candidatus Auribacterota bacterium]|jgi:hypothetical protein|nr:hypothetical protein [Candidatus Auribacterota bacterium]
MNILLKKILINFSIVVFIATFFISMNVGTPILECFLRASLALLVVALLGRFVLTSFFKDVALEIAKHERQKEQKKNNDNQAEDGSEEDYDADDDTYEEQNVRSGSIIDNPFADNEPDEK